MDIERLQQGGIAGESDSFVDENSSAKDSSSLDGSSTTDASSNNAKDNAENKVQLAKAETTAVFHLRLLVFVVLFLAAVAVSVIVYFITAGSENEEADTQYEEAAEKLLQAFVDIVDSKLSVMSSLGVAFIAHGVDHTRQWPFVTLSSFQQRAATARSQSGSLYVHVSPFVAEEDREEWEDFVLGEDSEWIQQGIDYQETLGLFDFMKDEGKDYEGLMPNKNGKMWYHDDQGGIINDSGPGPYLPVWETSPILPGETAVNRNLFRYDEAIGGREALSSNSVAISPFITAPPGDMNAEDSMSAFLALLLSGQRQKKTMYKGDPMSQVFFPMFDNFNDDRKTVAIMVAWINWASYFVDVLPHSTVGIDLVLQDSCGGVYSYKIDGGKVIAVGEGDRHEQGYDDKKRSATFDSVRNIADGTKFGLPLNQDQCKIMLDVYPSGAFYNVYSTNTPIVITVAVLAIFFIAAFMFVVYDRLVERRQAIVLRKAVQTTNIVNSLFPSNVADRLMQANDSSKKDFVAPNRRLKSFLTGSEEDDAGLQPIADLFPNCTVMFADIAGFTAWSSTRDPAQVFILLQTVYQAFDAIAKRRKVFKVETIGDSYVAVTGLPDPQVNHAVIMARFASECLNKVNELTAEMEKTLGPDTGDLTMRLGLHSGPVTAGVLRGDRARFQLFGDTVNTAARMESTGTRSRIQISSSTYECLVAAGKGHWAQPREDAVEAKGKGKMKTFWLTINPKKPSSSMSGGESETSDQADAALMRKHEIIAPRPSKVDIVKQDRLVNWMAEMLKGHIKKIVARRKFTSLAFEGVFKPTHGTTPLEEVAEVIVLPRYDATAQAEDHQNVQVSPVVLKQLREYVSIVASTYHDNPFHNFEHACHVAMATDKFIRRIVAPDIATDDGDIASKLHNYTHGINSDPLTVLAILFSALAHDCDHRGVSNMQLIEEEKAMASNYNNKSVAEQNSFDIAWNLLMMEQFVDLRGCLFATSKELKRFRQVMVNVVLATDIFDKELNDLRKNRWQKAFSQEDLSDQQENDLRATIVIEHIIQASDVSHTMQHWHIYRKWNQRLFTEMYSAFRAGRMAKDPSEFWYNGELGFFDNYIIPLAKKLKDCNVFGVSSDECLDYAKQNRAEWAERGQELVAEIMNEIQNN